MKKRRGSYWKHLAHRRNGLLGRLTSARNMCQHAQYFEGLSKVDRGRIHLVLLELDAILFSWDKHYVRKLRKKYEETVKGRGI